MDTVLAARILMGVSLGFHIIYATIGIGLPLMLMIAEWQFFRTGDEEWRRIARGWIRPAAVLFAIGAVSGTILSFELGLLWPRFMEFGGPLVGIAFSMEGFAFFTEAIFLALYTYGERRLSRGMLFFCTIPLTLAAAASAVFVISANAWMNTPSGFRMVDGVLSDVSPWRAFFNPAWAHEAVHGTLAAYVATGFAMAGVHALALLRGRDRARNSRALALSFAVGAVALPLLLFSGHWSAHSVAQDEKPKLAAMEALFTSQRGAPLIIGGWPDPEHGTVRYGIKIPWALSLLAHHDPDALVEGLDAFPPGDVPDPRLVHPFFDLMVGSFFVMFVVAAWYWWRRLRRGEALPGRRMLALVLAASPFGMLALESGWLVTEFGRQPWIVQGYMRVAGGVTPSGGIGLVLVLFLLLYLILTMGLLVLLVGRADRKGKIA
ncbi:MAG: cytochrome ubiquinol oxidase subunit I [Geobacteraceae bacterium]